MTPTEKNNKPFRLRIPPTCPREKHVFSDGMRFERARGWYPIDAREKTRFEQTRLFDTSASSPPLFQIVTAERAIEIDIEEGRAGAGAEQKQAAREAALRAEMDGTKAELAKVQQLVASQGDVIAAQADALKRFEVAMAQLASPATTQFAARAVASQTETEAIPATERKGALSNTTNAPALAASTEDAKRIAEEEDARAARPTRPGETKSKGGKAKSSPSAEKDSVSPKPSDTAEAVADDPMGAGQAVAAHDESLRTMGATLPR